MSSLFSMSNGSDVNATFEFVFYLGCESSNLFSSIFANGDCYMHSKILLQFICLENGSTFNMGNNIRACLARKLIGTSKINGYVGLGDWLIHYRERERESSSHFGHFPHNYRIPACIVYVAINSITF